MPLAPTAAASAHHADALAASLSAGPASPPLAAAEDAARTAERDARAAADRAFDRDVAMKNEMADILVEYIDNGCTPDDLRGRGYTEAEILRCGPAAAAIARRRAQRRAA